MWMNSSHSSDTQIEWLARIVKTFNASHTQRLKKYRKNTANKWSFNSFFFCFGCMLCSFLFSFRLLCCVVAVAVVVVFVTESVLELCFHKFQITIYFGRSFTVSSTHSSSRSFSSCCCCYNHNHNQSRNGHIDTNINWKFWTMSNEKATEWMCAVCFVYDDFVLARLEFIYVCLVLSFEHWACACVWVWMFVSVKSCQKRANIKCKDEWCKNERTKVPQTSGVNEQNTTTPMCVNCWRYLCMYSTHITHSLSTALCVFY